METTFKIQDEGLCRNLFHVDVHDPKTPRVFCNFCDSYVKENPITKKICQCCGNNITKKKEYISLRKMLNNAIDSYEPLIKFFIKNPIDGRIVVSQKWKYITYEIPLDCLSLYYDMREPVLKTDRKGGLPIWAKQHFRPDALGKIKEKGVLGFIDSHTKSAWIG